MFVSSRPPVRRPVQLSATAERRERRLWKTPRTGGRLRWLGISALLYLALLAWYLYALKSQAVLEPASDPLRLFGIVAYLLILTVASYTLRRRFLRRLPGMVQNWLWMHTWLGLLSLLVALLHENFTFVTHDYCLQLQCVTDSYGAGGALLALILLVLIGLVGRVLDYWQSRVIAHEAALNGNGIIQSVQARLRHHEYMIERYCAGKSNAFKWACSEALAAQGRLAAADEEIPTYEMTDWLQVCQILAAYAQLTVSLRRQLCAQSIIRAWRIVHGVVALLSLIVISYHGTMELLTNVFHVLVVAH